jgi:hypothetical protein
VRVDRYLLLMGVLGIMFAGVICLAAVSGQHP